MKYCIKCGNKLNDDDKFCEKCGYKIKRPIDPKTKKTIIISTIIAVLVLLIASITIKYVKKYIEDKEINNYINNKVYDKNSDINHISSFHCKRCSDSCGETCLKTKDDKNCMIHKFNIKDKDVEYDMYYINKNNKISCQDNRNIKLNYKNAKELFENKYSDYNVDIEYTSDFDTKHLKFDNKFEMKMVKIDEISNSLTEELYNDIYYTINKINYVDKVDYITLTMNKDLKLLFNKNTIAILDGVYNTLYYEVKIDNKSYEEILNEIIDNKDNKK